MALSYESYDDQLTGQNRIRQRQIIENHGKVNFHLGKNEQLPNMNFINYGEVNVYVNSPAKSKETIDNPTITRNCSNSCERLLPAPQIQSDLIFGLLGLFCFIIFLFSIFSLL
jgi:hypothetical protein